MLAAAVRRFAATAVSFFLRGCFRLGWYAVERKKATERQLVVARAVSAQTQEMELELCGPLGMGNGALPFEGVPRMTLDASHR